MQRYIKLIAVAFMLATCLASQAATFTVTITADCGEGSLRWAIEQANLAPDPDTIAFDIPGVGPHTIQPLSQLPSITDPVVIDGYTQPGAIPNTLAEGDNAVLMIELDGSLPEVVYAEWIHGLHITAGNSTIRGLVINRFYGSGIWIQGGGGNIVQGNFIGTDVAGSVAMGNRGWWGNAGVFIGSDNNVIGGTTPAARNVISGNDLGVDIQPGHSNLIQGNFIGTDRTGTAAIPNTAEGGVAMWGGSGNRIGTPGAGNLISGNAGHGIVTWGDDAVVIEGNLVGTDVTGKVPLGNTIGVAVFGKGGRIGGTVDGAGNVISGNKSVGLSVYGTDHTAQGNQVGTDITGTLALGNDTGIVVGGADNVIGGTAAEARNVISGNLNYGVQIGGDGASHNRVEGNFIGTDITGTAALGNFTGVYVFFDDNVIGGTLSGAGNVISGNRNIGVFVDSNDNEVQGNFIGTDVDGTVALPNTTGVYVSGPGGNNLIGGSVPGAGNLISGNRDSGIDIYSSRNLVKGNFIGTDATGTKALGNGGDGIRINVWVTTGGNIVGGTEAGARNIISGNGSCGIEFQNIETDGVIQGNYIGTDVTGTQSIPGQDAGILIQGGGGHLIGGTTAEARNVLARGIIIYSPNNVIQGNYVGVDATGSTTFLLGGGPEIFRGFQVATLSAHDNQIGGTEPGAANVVSGCDSGIWVEGCNRNRIQGNIVGADASGTIALGNRLGIGVQSTPEAGSENLVEGNLVVASRQAGIMLNRVSKTRVEGNLVGTDRTRTLNLGNQIGIYLDACSETKVGGTEVGAANTIAFSRLDGVVVVDDYLSPVPVQGNSIRGNSIWQSGNSIQRSVGLGVNLVPYRGDWDIEPPPWSDWQLPVVTLNDPADDDIGPNNLQNFPVITASSSASTGTMIEGTLNSTPNATFTLDFYANPDCDNSGHGEGEWYLGWTEVATDGEGNATFSVALSVSTPIGFIITATATDAAGNTSEFSDCSPPVVQGDTTPPVITTPGNISGEATGPAGKVVTFSASAQDDVSGAVSVTCAPQSGSVFPLGTTTVTCTATDAAGNTAIATFTVTVVDTTPPTIQCPADIYAACSVDALVPVAFSVTTSDAVDPSPAVTCTPASGSVFPIGETLVTCTATDDSGNTASCSFKVIRAALGFTGFLPPIGGADATGGSFADPVRTFKAGSTIPVKFTAACEGASVLTGIHRLQAIKFTDATTSDDPIDATPQGAATTGNQFRLTDGQWQFNLDTKATGMTKGIWQLSATLSDGSQHGVWIQLK